MKQCNPGGDSPFAGIEKGLKSVMSAQMLLGGELMKTAGGAFQWLRAVRLPAAHRCCEVPEPCWMPLSLGEICCSLRPGDSGTACLVVTNGDYRPRSYEFVASGQSAAAIAFSVTSVTLGPKERLAVTATITMPAESAAPDCRGIHYDALIWVRGCRDHYLRWIVRESASAMRCGKEVTVDDCPDYFLHWYDHFYQQRPCFGVLNASSAGVPIAGAKS